MLTRKADRKDNKELNQLYYRLARTAGGLVLRRAQAGLLRGHQTLRIGWMRCDANEVLHVAP